MKSLAPWVAWMFAGLLAARSLAQAPAAPTPATPKFMRFDRQGDSIVLAAPIERWDEALPLGNGLTGGLLWGSGATLNLSLDRGDLWDLRQSETVLRPDWTYQAMQKLVAAKDQAGLGKMFDAPYDLAYPTKLPAGRVRIRLPEGSEARSFRLDLHRAEARVDLGSASAEGFFSAAKPIALFRLSVAPTEVVILRPAGLDKLGYGPAEFGAAEGTQWMVQRGAEGLVYAVVVGTVVREPGAVLAVSITSGKDDADPLALGKRGVAQALAEGYDSVLAPHLSWWRAHWSISSVSVPDADIQTHYDLCSYLYGAGSRPGSPPIPLQGVWTADEGNLPPWKGDYHNDLNTQMTYLAYHAAGLTDCGRSFLDFNSKLLPRYRRFAKEFFGVGGAAVPGVMDLTGAPMGGWGMYSLSPTNGAWIAQSYYLHWRHTLDERFLIKNAYPFCSEIGTGLLGILKPDGRGKLVLPLSSSPEIHDNTLRAFLKPNSNYDLALLRWLFAALAEMAPAAGHSAEAERWSAALARLDGFDTEGETGSLTFAPGEPYQASHRHFSHLMAIHPLGLLTIEGTENDRAVINASLDRVLEKGPSQWCGYSYSWMACMLARCGRAEEALDHLQAYQRAFTLRNGFHANGDQSGTGLSNFTYRPFTLEGNFLAMQAVHEMLLQGWGGTVRVFPAVSERWADVSFRDLRAEGGYRVTAERRGGRTARVQVVAGHDGELRLRNPFDDRAAAWNLSGVRREGRDYIVSMKAGAALEGTPSGPP
jgi:alpha-L-fucosidase 2